MNNLVSKINHLGPCSVACIWLSKQESAAQAWKNCERGDWMLWLLGSQITSAPWSKDRKPLLACTLDCAETVKHLWPKKSAVKIADAIRVLRQWIVGTATTDQAKEAGRNLYEGGATAAYTVAYTATVATAYADAAASTDAGAYAAAAVAYAAAAAAGAAVAAYTADAGVGAYDAARQEKLAECAAIVRKHYPKPPKIRSRKDN